MTNEPTGVCGRIVNSAVTVLSSIVDLVHRIRRRKPHHVLCGSVLGLLIGPICGFQSVRWSGRRIVEEMSPALVAHDVDR